MGMDRMAIWGGSFLSIHYTHTRSINGTSAYMAQLNQFLSDH